MSRDVATETPTSALTEPPIKIPRLVKRNTLLLASSQALVGSGTQMVPTLGAIMAVQLLGSLSLAGVSSSVSGLSRFLISYPLGRIMDSHGRKAGLMLGLSLGLIGAVLNGLSVIFHSVPLFFAGLLVFGMGVAAGHQLRLAAADMYPPSRRAEGLGYVLTGSLAGAIGGPAIISLSQYLAPQLGTDQVALPWLLLPVIIVTGIVLVSQIRPDPKEIGAHLERYYPGYKRVPAAGGVRDSAEGETTSFRYFPKLVAVVCNVAVHGNMVMMMAMTPLVLNHHGHALPAISLSVALHVVGMYVFSMPIGKLSDVIGRRWLMFAGIIIAAIGSVLVPITPDYWTVTAGIFLVGVGWSCVNVTATATIADTTPPAARGRAIGTVDTYSNAAGIVLPFLAGPMVDLVGLHSLGIVGVLLMIVPFLLVLRLHEPRPGRFLNGLDSR